MRARGCGEPKRANFSRNKVLKAITPGAFIASNEEVTPGSSLSDYLGGVQVSTESNIDVDNLSWALPLISQPRLAPYLTDADGKLPLAVQSYRDNLLTSAALFSWLGFTEIALRNAILNALTPNDVSLEDFDPFITHWSVLSSETKRDYDNAVSRLVTKSQPATTNRIAAELNFGFWRYLLSARYESTLWTPYLQHAFQFGPVKSRHRVHSEVEVAVVIRNKIAHHERIRTTQVVEAVTAVEQILTWIEPTALTWARANLPKLEGWSGPPDTE